MVLASIIVDGKDCDEEAEPWDETAESHCYSLIAGVDIKKRGVRKTDLFLDVSLTSARVTLEITSGPYGRNSSEAEYQSGKEQVN